MLHEDKHLPLVPGAGTAAPSALDLIGNSAAIGPSSFLRFADRSDLFLRRSLAGKSPYFSYSKFTSKTIEAFEKLNS